MNQRPIENSLANLAKSLAEAVEPTPRGVVDVFPDGPYTTLRFHEADGDDLYDILSSFDEGIRVFSNRAVVPNGSDMPYLEDLQSELADWGYEVAIAH